MSSFHESFSNLPSFNYKANTLLNFLYAMFALREPLIFTFFIVVALDFNLSFTDPFMDFFIHEEKWGKNAKNPQRKFILIIYHNLMAIRNRNGIRFLSWHWKENWKLKGRNIGDWLTNHRHPPLYVEETIYSKAPLTRKVFAKSFTTFHAFPLNFFSSHKSIGLIMENL